MLPSKILQSQERELELESLPAAGESPLSSAVVAKAKDGDDGGGRADLLHRIGPKMVKEYHGKDDGIVIEPSRQGEAPLPQWAVSGQAFQGQGCRSSPSPSKQWSPLTSASS